VKAYDELNEMLKNEKDLEELEQYQAALKIMEEAKLQLPS
jgi:tubulin-specific chaperone A